MVNLDHGRFDPSGFALIAMGCFKKAVIADNLASIVDATYADPSQTFSWALWIGTYAFAIQIYCDFSGYSDIAVGLSRLLGIDLVQNFKAPYASRGPSELWRRWHISLSSWLRDYLYIPLGGNRHGPSRTMVNLMLTMLLGGLWHGAAGNYVLWGAFHGGLLALARPLRGVAQWLDTGARRLWSIPLRRLVFFHLICLGWALFRAQSLADCKVLLTKLLWPFEHSWQAFWAGVGHAHAEATLAFLGVCMIGIVGWQLVWPTDSKRLTAWLWRMPEPVRFAVVLGLLYVAMIFAPEQPPPFIYFQF
jgi:D-alanyl-lipoteichoic acid acyltransferase DltB (MBOAT superfamily)